MPFVSITVICIAAVAAFIDVRTRRIPNALTFGSALVAIFYHLMAGGPAAAGLAAVGWFIGALIFFPVFALGGMGAGDVKLIAALGAWLGPVGVLYVAVGSAIAGGVVA